LILIGILVLIRLKEKSFFDDGLIDFFKNSYQTGNLPTINFIEVLKIISLRFWLNSLISITILSLFFKFKKLIEFLLGVYALAYIILIVAFYFAWKHYQAGNYLTIFYIRRILIQPLLFFILIPALYYHKIHQD